MAACAVGLKTITCDQKSFFLLNVTWLVESALLELNERPFFSADQCGSVPYNIFSILYVTLMYNFHPSVSLQECCPSSPCKLAFMSDFRPLSPTMHVDLSSDVPEMW